MHLLSATLTISEDEPALALRETNRPRPDFRGRNRYQIIYVVRNGEPVEWQQDMGPEENYTADEFNLIGGVKMPDGGIEISENVGRLREMANQIRQDGFASDHIYGKGTTVNFVDEYHDEADRRRRAAVGRRVFGKAS